MMSRSVLIAAIATLGLLAACGSESESGDALDLRTKQENAEVTGSRSWPVFRGNLQQTGVAETSLPDAPQLLWAFEAGADIESTAAIYDGKVYVGALDARLRALDLETGEELWSYQAEEEIRSTPSVYDGTVFFGDELGFFHAVDAHSGELKWRYESYAGVISGATFHGDRVLFGSYDNSLYCLNRSDGTLVWQVETDGYVHGTPAIIGDLTTVSGCDGFLWLIEIADGSVLTKIDLRGQSASSPAVVGEATTSFKVETPKKSGFGNFSLSEIRLSSKITFPYLDIELLRTFNLKIALFSEETCVFFKQRLERISIQHIGDLVLHSVVLVRNSAAPANRYNFCPGLI